MTSNLTLDESSEESEESEQKSQIPTVQKKKTEKDKKTSSGTPTLTESFKKWFDEKVEKTFFTNYNKFFGEDYYKKCTVLPDVKADARVEIQLKLFTDSLEKKIRSKLTQGNSDEDYEFAEKQTNRQVPLMDIVYDAVSDNFRLAVIFRILRQVAGITIPFIMKEFLKQIKAFQPVNIQYALIWCFAASFLAFWRENWGQLSLRYTSSVRSRAREMIQDWFYKTLTETNIDFISSADYGLLIKLLIYDTQPIYGYMVSRVGIYAAPVSIIYACGMVLLEFRTNNYLFLIFAYFILMLAIVASLQHLL